MKIKTLTLICAVFVGANLLNACSSSTTVGGESAGGKATANVNQNNAVNTVENKPAENKNAAKPEAEKQTADGLPEFKKNEDYGSVREKLLNAGWTPHRSKDADKCAAGDKRCEGRPEMQSCAGTGMANCKFLWKKGEKMLAIFTVGESAVYSGQSFESENSADTSKQTAVLGQYKHRQKIDEGRNTLELIFEIAEGGRAIYRNVQDGMETQKRNGTWTWNEGKNQLTVNLSPVPNGLQGQEVKLTFVFQQIGNNLKLVTDLPYKQGAGEIYEKF
jgi:hypothetical protein